MTVEPRDVGHRSVLAVSGEIDMASAPSLRSALEAAFDAGARELCLDLCATTFMDSSGLHVLLQMQGRAEALGRRLTIVCPPGPARRVLELTGATKALRVHADLSAAYSDA